MNASVEITKIFKSSCVDNSQVCCIADKLVTLIDEGFASRFVNKLLDDSEIKGVEGLPSTFPVEKFIGVNQVWKRQGWKSKHRLDSAKIDSAVSKCQTRRMPPTTVGAYKMTDSVASNTKGAEADCINAELIARLGKVNEELKLAIKAKAKAEAEAVDVQKEIEKLAVELDATKKKMDEAVQMATELNAEKKKNESMLSALKAAFPEDVTALGARLAKAMSDTIGARRVIYLYLGVIASEPIEVAAFVNRFRLFDDELYWLFKDDPEKLQQVRDMFAADINSRLTGQRVTWDFLGAPFNNEKFSTSDSFGTEVTEVISALITTVNDSVVRRAKVKTEEINA